MENNKHTSLIFWVLIILLCFLYDYPSEFFQRPHGMHSWRQCDGAQFASNYFQESMDFFEPRLSICTGNDGKMVSEFPILYYLAAWLYKLFGKHDFFLRGISLILFFLGIYALFKCIFILLKNAFYAVIVSLIIFTSPVIIDYANNFLPDVPALSLTFMGYYFFLRYRENKKTQFLIWASILFSLAGLLKITSLIGFFAIIGTYCIQFLIQSIKNKNVKRIENDFALIVFFLTPIVTCFTWIIFMKHYNHINNNTFYFTTDIRPYWDTDASLKIKIWNRFDWQWLKMYMYRDFLHCLPFLSFLCFIIPNKKNNGLQLWFFLTLIISFFYFLLFFKQFFHHDYYVICMLIIPTAAITILLHQIKVWNETIFHNSILKIGLLVLFGIMIYHGKRINKLRDSENVTQFSEFRAYWEIEPLLDSVGITRANKIVSVGDFTTGSSLYLMNRRGWTQCGMTNQLTKSDIENFIHLGASYLMVYKNCEVNLDASAAQYLALKPITILSGIKIYPLK